MKSRRQSVVKRSMRIGRNRTSLALEPLFWEGLEAMAREHGLSIPKMCLAIEAAKSPGGSLTAAVRCAVLQHVSAKAAIAQASRAAA